MIRRRRRPQEIAFSFDSFLDVVANVVGVIIRLILVVWVGARSYSSVMDAARLSPPPGLAAAEERLPHDPLEDELAQNRRELAEAQQRLLEQLRQLQGTRDDTAKAGRELASLSARRADVERELARLEQQAQAGTQAAARAGLTAVELKERLTKLTDELRALEKLPPPRKTLRYRTPVSQPVRGEELHFECCRGRVSFIDLAALLDEVKRGVNDKAQVLRNRWEVRETVGPLGAFRLRYVLERERGALDAVGNTATPDNGTSFRYGLSSWEVEPALLERGDTEKQALVAGSEFRQVTDPLAGQQAVVTLWVYPDSFAIYRRLRDYLYEHDIVVAGRPLPEGVPIASSRRGSVSRGQ